MMDCDLCELGIGEKILLTGTHFNSCHKQEFSLVVAKAVYLGKDEALHYFKLDSSLICSECGQRSWYTSMPCLTFQASVFVGEESERCDG